MAYIDVYGRPAPTPSNLFDYPQPRMPYPVEGPRYFSKPAAASRIFGMPNPQVLTAEDDIAVFDPSSVYSYTKKNMGLGGLGADRTTQDAIAEIEERERIATRRREAFERSHPKVVDAQTAVLDVMKTNPATTALVVLVVGALGITALKTIGKFF